VFERDGYIALVERRGEGFGNVGSAGLLTEKGLAPVMYRSDGAFFVSKGFSQPAEPEQLETLRRFQQDLIDALA
jgi:hypothetical protein